MIFLQTFQMTGNVDSMQGEFSDYIAAATCQSRSTLQPGRSKIPTSRKVREKWGTRSFVLLVTKKADAGGERAGLAGRESGERVGEGIDGAVDDIRVAAASDVVESTAQCQVVSEKVEAFFGLQVQGEVERESF